MIIKEKLYITITSWHKRIGNLKPVLESILAQTLQPYKIIVNLCIQDFPNCEEDLPKELMELISKNSPMIEIYWFIENYKAWKKHLHTLEIVNPEDLIISTDDDHIYPKDFIEKMYVSYCFYGKKYPITLNKIQLVHNMWTFNGPATLYWKNCFPKDYKKYLTYDILHHCIDDTFISILFVISGHMLMPEIFHLPEDKEMLYNDICPYTDYSPVYRTSKHIKEDVDEIHLTREETLYSMNKTLDSLYFKGQKTIFTPSFWDILYRFIEEQKSIHTNPCVPMKYMFDKFYENYLQGNYNKIDYKSLGLDKERKSKDELIGAGNKVIVTISSWYKRIENVAPVLESIIYNTISPDVVYINLAKEDFEYDEYNGSVYDNPNFPNNFKELIFCKKVNTKFVINWYDDAGLKSWKKHVKVITDGLNSDSLDDVVLCIDDDIIYKSTYIETMLKSYNFYNRKYPISCFTNCFCQGGFAFCGYGTLYKIGHFKDFNKYMTSEMYHKFPEDNHLLNILNINGYPIMPVIGRNYLFEDYNFNEGESNFGNLNFTEEWWNSYKDIMEESERIIQNTCSNREEMKFGWKPICFNFSISNLSKFLNEEQEYKNKEIYKEIYNTVEMHLNNNPGSSEELYGLSKIIDDIIL